MIELNWVVLTWSCRDVDEVPSASLNCSPPGCFEVYYRNISFPSFFDGVWREGPTLSGGDARHNEELGLNVTLPLNVSLDLGLRDSARDDLAISSICGDMPALSLADEIPVFAVSNGSPVLSCIPALCALPSPHSHAAPHSRAVSARLSCLF